MSAIVNDENGGTAGMPDVGAPITLTGANVTDFPGAALLVGADSSVLAGNAEAGALRQSLIDIPTGCVATLVRQAAGGRPVNGVVEVVDGRRTLEMELLLLPLADGRVLVLGKDITLEVNLRTALIESRQRYKDLVEVSSDFAWEIGADGRFAFVSPQGALGYTATNLIGSDPGLLIAEDPVAGASPPFLTTRHVENVELWMRRADGGLACLLCAATPLHDTGGQWTGARGICRDVTLERLRDAALARANNRERLLNHIIRTIRDILDPAGMLGAAAEATARAFAAAACRMYRRDPDTGAFEAAATFGTADDDGAVLAALRKNDSCELELGPHRVLAAVCRYRQTVNGAVVVWRDRRREPWTDDERLLLDEVAGQVAVANEQVANHERIVTLSRTDALTGLYNRRAFFEELERRFARLNREHRAAALIYVDLDNFKQVNDAFGHQRGDEALLAVREVLLHHSRPTDLVARLGGDEFAMWLDGADEATAVARGATLIQAAETLRRFSPEDGPILHMSIGIAVHDNVTETAEEMSHRADEAMYAAKRHGKATWRLAPPAVRESAE